LRDASFFHLALDNHMHDLEATQNMRAQRKFLKPGIDRVRRLMASWSCSTTLFRNFFWRILIGVSRSALSSCSAARSAFVAQLNPGLVKTVSTPV
jgi:hypothetical protein